MAFSCYGVLSDRQESVILHAMNSNIIPSWISYAASKDHYLFNTPNRASRRSTWSHPPQFMPWVRMRWFLVEGLWPVAVIVAILLVDR